MHFPCLEGAIHWTARAIGNWNEQFVLSFDLSGEVFKMISMPNELAKARIGIETSIFRGSLSLVCDENYPNKPCTIWILKEYGVVESWYEYVKVDLIGGIRTVLGTLKNGNILLERCVRTTVWGGFFIQPNGIKKSRSWEFMVILA